MSACEIPADALQAAFRDDLQLTHAMMLTVMELLVESSGGFRRQKNDKGKTR